MTRNSVEGCPRIPCGLDTHLRKCHDSLYMMSGTLFIWTIQTVGTKQSDERGAVQFLPLLHQQLARVCTVTCEHECLYARVWLVAVACYRVSSYKWEGTQCVSQPCRKLDKSVERKWNGFWCAKRPVPPLSAVQIKRRRDESCTLSILLWNSASTSSLQKEAATVQDFVCAWTFVSVCVIYMSASIHVHHFHLSTACVEDPFSVAEIDSHWLAVKTKSSAVCAHVPAWACACVCVSVSINSITCCTPVCTLIGLHYTHFSSSCTSFPSFIAHSCHPWRHNLRSTPHHLNFIISMRVVGLAARA